MEAPQRVHWHPDERRARPAALAEHRPAEEEVQLEAGVRVHPFSPGEERLHAHLQTGLLEHLAHDRRIGSLAGVHAATGKLCVTRERRARAVADEDERSAPYDRDRDLFRGGTIRVCVGSLLEMFGVAGRVWLPVSASSAWPPGLRRPAGVVKLAVHEKGGGPLSSDSTQSTREVPER
jgi:hypothetical protein